MKKVIKFKEAFNRLENIVSELESEDVDVEEAVNKYEEGLRLVGLCKEKLEEVEMRVKEIKNKAAESRAA
jgi:exodeoxyribonuclease VII small subunit